MTSIVIGSRGSKLALWQARFVESRLRACHPDLACTIEIIKTTGDKLSEIALTQMRDTKGLFVKEIEEALLDDRIDLAVHSLKDVPAQLPEGLRLAAIPSREDPRDALVRRTGSGSWRDLPSGGRIATGSLRRRVQLLALRPDLRIEDIRGNVDTRLRKLEEQEFDGLILAGAGLRRLDLKQRIAYLFPVEEMIPAVGQGALAIEVRCSDDRVEKLLEPLHDSDTAACVEAERAFLQRMGGGCQVPMGGHARMDREEAWFDSFLSSPHGGRRLSENARGSREELRDMALRAADALLGQGAEQILQEFEALD